MPLTVQLRNYLAPTTTPVELASPNSSLAASFSRIYKGQFDPNGPDKYEDVQHGKAMGDHFLARAMNNVPFVNSHLLTGVTLSAGNSTDENKILVTGWFNNQPYHVPPLSLNLIHNALLILRTGDSAYRLNVTNHPLPFTEFEKMDNEGGGSSIGFQVGFNLAFGMAFLSASFVLFLGISHFL